MDMNTPSHGSKIPVGLRPGNTPAQDASALARSLLQMLDGEFDALKQRDIARFETLQTEKANLLALIGVAAGPEAERLPAGALREGFKDLILQCRDALRRNECLVSHQLASIRGGISSLRSTGQNDARSRAKGLQRGMKARSRR